VADDQKMSIRILFDSILACCAQKLPDIPTRETPIPWAPSKCPRLGQLPSWIDKCRAQSGGITIPGMGRINSNRPWQRPIVQCGEVVLRRPEVTNQADRECSMYDRHPCGPYASGVRRHPDAP